MNRRTACGVSISPRYKPVTLLPSRLAANRVTVDATSTEDAGGHTPAAILEAVGARTCLNPPPTLFVYGRVGTAVSLDVQAVAEKEWGKQIGPGNL
jgi:hypothetical protein